MRQLRLEVDGRPYDVLIETDEAGRRTVTVEGRTFEIGSVRQEPGAPRRLVVDLDGRPHAVERRDLHNAVVDQVASMFRIDSITLGAGAGTVGREGASIRPPMPGKIVSLRVQPGESVAAGQVLLVLEAMKMQNEVTSPAAGVVTELKVKVGQNVDNKDVLVVLGPPEETAEPAPELQT